MTLFNVLIRKCSPSWQHHDNFLLGKEFFEFSNQHIRPCFSRYNDNFIYRIIKLDMLFLDYLLKIICCIWNWTVISSYFSCLETSQTHLCFFTSQHLFAQIFSLIYRSNTKCKVPTEIRCPQIFTAYETVTHRTVHIEVVVF